MKKIIVSGSGFPGTTKTLEHLQEGASESFSGLARWVGDLVILSGVEKIGNTSNYTDGYVSYKGEIIPFEGGTKLNNSVSLFVNTENAQYDNGGANLLPAYQTKYFCFNAVAGASETFTFSLFKRISLQSMQNKLAGIEQNAQKNVKPDWNVTNINSPFLIQHKPFTKFKVTSGVVMAGQGQSTVYMYPPSGFHATHLSGIFHVSYILEVGNLRTCSHTIENGKIKFVFPLPPSAQVHTAVQYLAIWTTEPDNAPPNSDIEE